MLKIQEKIDWLMKINKENSDKFIQDELSRKFYKGEHGTNILAFKCMDGRINLPVVTKIPLGIIKPYRNLGGRFDLGWPMLGQEIQDIVEDGASNGHKILVLITYHYSEGDTHRGCAGFSYDKEAALNYFLNLHDQFNRIFYKDNKVIFPIVLGLETDTDSLIFHPENPRELDKVFRISSETETDDVFLISKINNLYPNMDESVRKDILPLIKGNISHVNDVKNSKRNLEDTKHKEFIVGIGRGFDWLHEPNTALIVGPFDPNLRGPIEKELSIILDNMKSGRINNDGFVVLSSAIFKKSGYDRNRAIEKTNFFCNEVLTVMQSFSELKEKAIFIKTIVNENTKLIEIVE